jgi:hypothetical protein
MFVGITIANLHINSVKYYRFIGIKIINDVVLKQQ